MTSVLFATRPSSPCAPLAPRAPRCRRERVDPVFTRAGADDIQQALELLGRSQNVIYMTFVAKGQTRPRPSEAANVAFAILRGPDTQMIRFGGARIGRGSPPDGDRSFKRPIKAPKTCPISHFCLLHTRHPEGGALTGRRRDRIAALTISGLKRAITNFLLHRLRVAR